MPRDRLGHSGEETLEGRGGVYFPLLSFVRCSYLSLLLRFTFLSLLLFFLLLLPLVPFCILFGKIVAATYGSHFSEPCSVYHATSSCGPIAGLAVCAWLYLLHWWLIDHTCIQDGARLLEIDLKSPACRIVKSEFGCKLRFASRKTSSEDVRSLTSLATAHAIRFCDSEIPGLARLICDWEYKGSVDGVFH